MVHTKMDPPSSHKRQRISANGGMSSLPDAILAMVGEYLALPSRALFSVALTAPSSSFFEERCFGGPSAAAVLPPGSVAALDFSDIEKDLAMRLSDDDLGAMLACVGAQTLRTLKLANCLSITGRGLESLRSSTAMQFIDLSLVGQFERPVIKGGALSIETVTSVLQSLVDAEGCALKYVALPHKWMAARHRLLQFLRSYSEHLRSNSKPCAEENCDNVSGPSPDRSSAFGWFYGGFQNYTCYECCNTVCEQCAENMEGIDSCNKCWKSYCEDCMRCDFCKCCSNMTCTGCGVVVCKDEDCGEACCSECARKHGCMLKCDACGEFTCESHNRDGCYVINTCSDCSRTLCIDCCKIQHCARECCSVICNDCQPKGWKCLWCEDDRDAFTEYEYGGVRCTQCFEQAKTHCHYCRKVKLREEDYLPPAIPTTHWVSCGYDAAYVEILEKFLQEFKVLTLQLKSGEKLMYDGSIILDWGQYPDRNAILLRHDDILLPHWREFTEALRQYKHESERNHLFRLSNFELHSSVLDLLCPALRGKQFRSLELYNLGNSANAVEFVADYAQSNPELRSLSWGVTPLDEQNKLELSEVVDKHSRLKSISFGDLSE